MAFGLYLKSVKEAVPMEGVDFKRPVGALAVATAVVERALKLVKDNKVNIKIPFPPSDVCDNTGKKKSPYETYCDAHWGDRTRSYAVSAKKLTDEKWARIHDAALEYSGPQAAQALQGSSTSNVNAPVDPRACIELCFEGT
ncbi:hypothetical protein CPC08DRAFT_460946 [Agrocybe pediades]|nr:hypothetical protein CPC08DRAFT_460946 [Agrocybe pediades]